MSAKKRKRAAWKKGAPARRGPGPVWRRPRVEEVVAAAVAAATPRPELKFHDLNIDDAVVATTGTIAEDSVLTIAQGTDESERVGRKIVVKQIGWRFDIQLPPSTASGATSDQVRVILYLDKQANGAAAAVTDLLETADYQSFNNLSNSGRFRTLMDRDYDLVAKAGGGDGTTEDYGEDLVSDTFFKKCNIAVEYSGTTGVIAQMTSNNIGVLLLSKSGFTVFKSNMRIRFTDA